MFSYSWVLVVVKSYGEYVFSINYYLWFFRSTHQPPTEDNNIVGPVICIGDFDDGYNMPPSSSPKVSDNAPFEPEIEALLVVRFLFIYSLNIKKKN